MYRKMTGAALLLVLFLFVLLREPSVLARESAPLLPEGSGTVEDPYLIRTADELALVSGNLNASYRLAADIDLSGVPWASLGSADAPFTGTFEGNGFVIRNLTADVPEGEPTGLFGCAKSAALLGITLENASVTGGNLCGALAGSAETSVIDACGLIGENTLTVRDGSAGAGGLCGEAVFTSILNSYVQADLRAGNNCSDLALLCGRADHGSIAGCAVLGTVEAGDKCSQLGGIAGSVKAPDDFSGNTALRVQLTAGNGTSRAGAVAGNAEALQIRKCTAKDFRLTAGTKSRELGGIAGRISAGGEGGSASLASCTASGFLFAPSPLSAGALAGRVSGATADACEASVSLNPTLLPAFGGSEDLLTSASFGTAVSRTSLYAVMLREEYAGVWETSAAEAPGAENAPALVQALREQLQAAGAALAPFDTFTLSGNTLGWTAKDGSSQSCSFENLGSCRVRNAGGSFREYDICRTDSDDPALACFFAEHTTDDGPLSLCFGSDEGALFRLASQGALPPAVWIEPDTSGKAVEDAIRALVRSAAP